MNVQTNCSVCKKVFWSKARKDPKTKEVWPVRVLCRSCENLARRMQMLNNRNEIRERQSMLTDEDRKILNATDIRTKAVNINIRGDKKQ